MFLTSHMCLRRHF